MEIIAADRQGLLARIGWCLADRELKLQAARIATYGERAEDVFFISNEVNEPLDDETQQALRESVTQALTPPDQRTTTARTPGDPLA